MRRFIRGFSCGRAALILGSMTLLVILSIRSITFEMSAVVMEDQELVVINATSKTSLSDASTTDLAVASWNIAAINNNPFEYWLSMDDEDSDEYELLMQSVEQFVSVEEIDNDGNNEGYDIEVKSIFTPKMFNELEAHMKDMFDAKDLPTVREMYESDYSNRLIVSEILRSSDIGSKRLASMPDRVTNTIPLVYKNDFAYRPTVINCYAKNLDSVDQWWQEWQNFMFTDEFDTVKTGLSKPAAMLSRISRSKYPELTEREEEVSIPLQTMVMAIFDSIMVHMLTIIKQDKGVDWQFMRSSVCESLNLKKNNRILELLITQYSFHDIVALQEVSAAFLSLISVEPRISELFHIVKPQQRSSSDQNSAILLRKLRFPNGIKSDLTQKLVFEKPKAIASGDITLVTAVDVFGYEFLIGSFHGDTNGLASVPLIKAVNSLLLPRQYLILGMDANTYKTAETGKKESILNFATEYSGLNLDSCWGSTPDVEQYTTYNARTFLQPQLNKASSRSEIEQKGDVNLKDYILFKSGTFEVEYAAKDNTGNMQFREAHVIPTPTFPSDHSLVSTKLTFVQ